LQLCEVIFNFITFLRSLNCREIDYILNKPIVLEFIAYQLPLFKELKFNRDYDENSADFLRRNLCMSVMN